MNARRRGATSAARTVPGARPQGGSRVAPVVASLFGIAYSAWFLSAPLPSLPPDEQGRPPTRFDLVLTAFAYTGEVAAQIGENALGAGGPSLFDRTPILAWAIGLGVCAWSLGRWLARPLLRDVRLSCGEQTVLYCATGASATSLATLGLGLAGCLQQPWLWRGAALLIAAGGVAHACWSWRYGRAIDSSKESLPSGADAAQCASRWSDGWPFFAAAPFGLFIVLGGLLPPAEFDVREYHLQAPKEFFLAGQIAFLPHNVYANMPLGSELLALAEMCLTGDWRLGALAGKTLTAGFALLTAAAAAIFARRAFGPRAGGWAALLYLSTPWTVLLAIEGLIDHVVGCYLVAATFVLHLCDEHRTAAGGCSWRLLALAGFLAGSAGACKYPGLLFAVVPLCGWAVWSCRPGGQRADDAPTSDEAALPRGAAAWRRATAAACVFALAASLACGPWLLKNAVLAGNPTYPLLYGLFGGQTRTPRLDAQWRTAHAPPDYRPASLLHSGAVLLGQSEWQSPLLPPLALAALWLLRKRPLVRRLGAVAVFVLAAWWLATHRIDRFWMPLVPLLAVVAAGGVVELRSQESRRWITAAGLLGAVWCLFTVCLWVGPQTQYLAPLEELRTSPLRVADWQLWLNEQEAATGVLTVGAAEVFDLQMPVAYSTVFDEQPLEQLARGRTSGELHAALVARGISHVVVHWGEIQRYRAPGNYGFTDFIQPELFERLVRDGVLAPVTEPNFDPVQIFRVRATPPDERSGG